MQSLKNRLHKIIFESDTAGGKIFDEILLGIILCSVLVVMLESISSIRIKYAQILRDIEWIITVIFTIEYAMRIWVTHKPVRYILSFYGLIDLLAILPAYLSYFYAGGASLLVIRALRLLRIFRIFKLSRYTVAGRSIAVAIWNSKEKLSVFIISVITIVTITGTLMYLIEGESNGFTSIPTSIYWAIVTLTTVGYGDLTPMTGLGKFLSGLVMILGFAIIAIPTGIVTAEFLSKQTSNTQVCPNCMFDNHDDDASYCKKCGTSLDITK